MSVEDYVHWCVTHNRKQYHCQVQALRQVGNMRFDDCIFDLLPKEGRSA